MSFLSLFLLLSVSAPGHTETFSGIAIQDSVLTQKAAKQLAANPLLAHANNMIIPPRGMPRQHQDHTFDFLVCIILLFFFGTLRQLHPTYIRNLFRAFGNVTLSNRQLKEQLQQNYLPGLLLDLLFCFSAAFFLYHTAIYLHWVKGLKAFSPALVLGALAACIGIVYLVRFFLLKMSGWAFQMPEAMGYYSFNIFLFNRVLGILLLPVSVIMAFGSGLWVQFFFLLAVIIAIGMYLFRFIRSRQVFGQFLKFSKFHFILYLCASEILPLAIMIKLIGTRLI